MRYQRTDLFAFVVELEVVDDGFGVEAQQRFDDRGVVVLDEPVTVCAGDRGERRERLRID